MVRRPWKNVGVNQEPFKGRVSEPVRADRKPLLTRETKGNNASRPQKARGKNGQCHRAFLEPADHGEHHVNGLPATQSQSGFLQYKRTKQSTENHATQRVVKQFQESEICTWSLYQRLLGPAWASRVLRGLGSTQNKNYQINRSCPLWVRTGRLKMSFYVSPKLGWIKFNKWNTPSTTGGERQSAPSGLPHKDVMSDCSEQQVFINTKHQSQRGKLETTNLPPKLPL